MNRTTRPFSPRWHGGSGRRPRNEVIAAISARLGTDPRFRLPIRAPEDVVIPGPTRIRRFNFTHTSNPIRRHAVLRAKRAGRQGRRVRFPCMSICRAGRPGPSFPISPRANRTEGMDICTVVYLGDLISPSGIGRTAPKARTFALPPRFTNPACRQKSSGAVEGSAAVAATGSAAVIFSRWRHALPRPPSLFDGFLPFASCRASFMAPRASLPAQPPSWLRSAARPSRGAAPGPYVSPGCE